MKKYKLPLNIIDIIPPPTPPPPAPPHSQHIMLMNGMVRVFGACVSDGIDGSFGEAIRDAVCK